MFNDFEGCNECDAFGYHSWRNAEGGYYRIKHEEARHTEKYAPLVFGALFGSILIIGLLAVYLGG